MLLVNMREEPEHVTRTVKSRGYRARTVLDASGEAARAYAVVGTPTVFVVARTGLIVGRAIGRREWAGPRGRALIEALLDGRP